LLLLEFLLLITIFNIPSLTASRKILFLARWFPDRFDPMMGLFIKRHAEVVSSFSEVAVLYLRADPDKFPAFTFEKKVENGVITLRVYYGTKSFLPTFIQKLIAGFLFIIAFTKGYLFLKDTWGKPDIIHVNVLTRLGVFALWLRWVSGIPYVITEHWSRYLPITGTYKGLLRKIITKVVVKNADAVSTVSSNLSESMQRHGLKNRNYIVLPNVVDTDAYVPAASSSVKKKKRFIHISCFEDRSKNISGLIRVIGLLSKTRSDFECLMVGEGIDLQKMKLLAAELGLKEPVITFAGLLENENLVKAYQDADFMVMFSNFENMPVVISESLSCGLPVIATAVGGIPEYINQDNGRLVEARDEDSLLQAVDYMLDHFQFFDKVQLRNYAIETFGKQAVAEKLRQIRIIQARMRR
jgi:glycosyltransferase involved in cell wall biosynthesis